ncbi:MAG: MFS transporter [Actinobacteria bacterium]|nr:MFS transporter [Actinomycetota bacterium]
MLGVVGLFAFIIVEARASQPMMNLRLFTSRLFALANLANLLNGISRGAVLFLLIFFLQGPYGKDPLMAGIMMAPFGIAFMLVGPLSGFLSDHHGARGLGTAGLLISAFALAGLGFITDRTPYWELAVLMAIIGAGAGLFNSPNVNVIMTSVSAGQRGMAAGIRIMLNNTGQMLSVAIAFPLVLATIPMSVMMKVFLYGGGMGSDPVALAAFLGGLHEAFFFSAGLSLVAAVASAFQPSHSPREAASAHAAAAHPMSAPPVKSSPPIGGGGYPPQS